MFDASKLELNAIRRRAEIDHRRVILVPGRHVDQFGSVVRYLKTLGLKPVFRDSHQVEMLRGDRSFLPVAVGLLSADDIGASIERRSNLGHRPDQASLFWIGAFTGVLGRDRTCIVCEPSIAQCLKDLSLGVLVIARDPEHQWRSELRNLLVSCGVVARSRGRRAQFTPRKARPTTEPAVRIRSSENSATDTHGKPAYHSVNWFAQLVREGVINNEQMAEAQSLASKLGVKIEEALLKLEYVTDAQAQQCVYMFVDLLAVQIPSAVIEMVPESVARENVVIPVSLDDSGSMTLAMYDPSRYDVLDKMRFITSRDITVVIAAKNEIEASIDRYYGQGEFGLAELEHIE